MYWTETMDAKKLFLLKPEDEGFDVNRGSINGPDDDVFVAKLLVTQELYFVLPPNSTFLEVEVCDVKPAMVEAVAKVQEGFKNLTVPVSVDYHVIPSVNDLNMGRNTTIKYSGISMDNLRDEEFIPTITEEDVALIHYCRKRERGASQRLKDKHTHEEDDDLMFDSDGRVHLKPDYSSEESTIQSPVKKRRGRPPKNTPFKN